MALTDRARLRELLERHGFTFSKAMGQNFLVNPSVCPRMAELARRAGRVVCVELDPRLPPILAETLAEFDNVEIVLGDVMEVDLQSLIAGRFGGMPVVVCANLPYYITTPILMRLLESRLPIEAITVMVQKEAAARLCAAPGERECGAISAAIAYYAEPRVLFPVSAGSFMPAPKVDSAVIRLDLRPKPPVSPGDERLMFELVRGAFAQRRKTVLNALSASLGIGKDELTQAFRTAGVDCGQRAERLTLQQFADLSDAVRALRAAGRFHF